MTLEQQVVSLELAKRLKELGVKQDDACFIWQRGYCRITNNETGEKSVDPMNWRVKEAREGRLIIPEMVFEWWWDAVQKIEEEWYSAFTVAELGEMLLVSCECYKTEKGTLAYSKGKWCVRNYGEHTNHPEFADTEADARAKMLIYLLENKLITL